MYDASVKSYSGLKKKVQMVSEVARNRFGSQEKRNFCCNGVGSWSMAPSKVLNCSHGLALSFEHSQYEQLAKRRALREFTNSGSLKKSSFFKKNFVLYPTIILLYPEIRTF